MRKNLRTGALLLSICVSSVTAGAQTLPNLSRDAAIISSDIRGRPGEFFNRHSISQWRADYVLPKAVPAPPNGIVCQDTGYVAFMKVLPDRNFLFESMPTTGGDYDRRSDRIQTYKIDHSDPSATFIFGCWKSVADFGDFDRAKGLWRIPGSSSLRLCEFAPGNPGKATCY